MDLSRAVYSRELKIAAMCALDAGSATGEIARKYQLSPKLLERWRGEWRAKGKLAFPSIGHRGADLPALDDARRMAELERKIGQLTMENDFLKKPYSISGFITRQPSSMARMSVWRNPTSAGERPSCEGAVSDDGPEPCRFLPPARPAATHTGGDGVTRSNAEGRAGVTGLWLSPHHAEIATARFRRQP